MLKQKEDEAKALKDAEQKAEKAGDGKFSFEQLSSCVCGQKCSKLSDF